MLEALREVAQRQSVLPELSLDVRPTGACLDPRGPAGAIHLEHLVEFLQVDRHRAGVAAADRRFDAAHHARTAAEGDHGSTGVAGPVQDADDILRRFRVGDQVGRLGDLAPEHPHRVGKRLAVGVEKPLVRVVAKQARERGRRPQPRRTQVEVRDLRHRRARFERRAEAFRGAGAEGVGLGRCQSLPFVTPTTELAS